MRAPHESPFRHHRPELGDGIVNRARLLSVLGQRFDRRLTVVQASAGFGKTTLLAQSMVENQLDPYGADAWLALTERDRQPDTLLAGLAEAVGAVAPVAAEATDLDELIEALWSEAPAEIAVIVDDAHVLDGSSAWELLARLSNSMPTNVHLVFGTRTPPPLPLRSLQSQGDAVIIDESQMAFDPDELRAFASLRGLQPGSETLLPAWPALAALSSSVGPEASTDFVWESILHTIPDARREALAEMVRFSQIDDELVHAVVGGRWTASSLVDGLPLIEAIGADRRFHDLWVTALSDEVDPERWRASLEAGADVLIARGESMRAARYLHQAGATDRVVDAAWEFAASSVSSGLSSPDAAWFVDALPAEMRHGSLGQYLRLLALGATNNDNIRSRMEDVTALALAEGDLDMAAMSIWRSIQFQADVDPTAVVVGDELAELIEQGIPFAKATAGLIASHQAETRHDIDAALAAVSMFDEIEEDNRRAATDSRFLALGHPERVETNLDAVLTEGATNPLTAQAIWQRGEIDPDLAWPIASELPARYGSRQLPNVQIPLLGVVTSVALAAGQVDAARDLAAMALRQSASAAPRLRLFAGVAAALVTLADEGEAAATAAFAELRGEAPIEPWPAWAYLSAVMPIRTLCPDTAWLDDIGFGPSLSTALAAARALLALREGSTAEAEALPWSSIDLLRVQVPAVMLVELACGAGRDRPEVAAALASVAMSRHHLRSLVDHPVAVVAEAARHHLAGEPRRPAYDLEIRALGELGIIRSDGGPVSDRGRGGRVQQLLGALIVSRSVRRTDIAAELWPDLDAKPAAANLRITLASLLDLLEPDRDPGSSWFIRTVDGRLELNDEGLTVDVHQLDHDLVAAREAERNGLPSVALEHFGSALERYGGELLPLVDLESVEHERRRLQSTTYNAGCRVGELLLAKAEPEQALSALFKASRIDPIAERARRIEIRCHLALGSTSAARSTAARLQSVLAAEGLAPDRETAIVLERLGV